MAAPHKSTEHLTFQTEETLFGKLWHREEDLLVAKFPYAGVFAFASDKPKLPFETVIATRHGNPNAPRRLVLGDLPYEQQRLANELSMIIGAKIRDIALGDPENADLSFGPIHHSESQAIPNHPHIVVAAARRGEGIHMYDGQSLGSEAAQSHAEQLRLSETEYKEASIRLGSIVMPPY